jgi:hypothetical protein
MGAKGFAEDDAGCFALTRQPAVTLKPGQNDGAVYEIVRPPLIVRTARP